MKLIKLTHRIFNFDESEIVSVYINIDYIASVEETSKETKELYKHRTIITLSNDGAIQEVCEDIEEVIRRIHLQTIKSEDGQFFINGELQTIKGE